jgi:hypothetical protein
MSNVSRWVLPLLLSACFAGPALSHPPERVSEYDWKGQVRPGRLVEISGLYGDIVVVPSMTLELRLHARRHGLRDDPGQVEVRVDDRGDRLRICTTRPGRDGACDPVPGFENVLDRDTDVDLHIELPLGCPLIVRTTYGDLDLRNITAEVHAFTEQGRCRIETCRGGEVATTNGAIELVPARMLPQQDLHVRSVNGRIRLDVPADFDAEVEAHTDNGRVRGDGLHAHAGEGTWAPAGGVPRNGRWVFGDPRGRIRLETENGDIELKRR